jgi:CDP-diacylglycerol---serine O-phosphatidyltransferase
MKRHIPNFLTCCNLLCGCLGILSIFGFGWQETEGPFAGFPPAAVFVWTACIFDFFDGFAARVLKVSSPIGKELDSLADVVSFGVLPSLFMFKLIQNPYPSHSIEEVNYLPFIGLLIAIFSALRLAVFNVDETQRDSFRGLPTPANALFITGLPFLHFRQLDFIHSPISLAVITVIFSLLLVSRIDLFALKFKNFTWADNKLRFTFLLLSVLLLVIFVGAAIPLIILLYILLSLGNRAFSR